jgi:predicted GNAT family acetyltransferase
MSGVIDNTQLNRFELVAEGQTAFIDYRRDGTIVTMIHTEVPPALNGRGIGSALAQGALELVQQRHESVVPRCSFISSYIDRHPAYQNVLAR